MTRKILKLAVIGISLVGFACSAPTARTAQGSSVATTAQKDGATTSTATPSTIPNFEPLKVPHPRILIFSPHPDDDVLAASGVMKAVLNMRAHGQDADLRVVYVTMGDSYGQALKLERDKGRSKTFIELGQQRHKEALAALQYVGVAPDKAIFFGFPDQSLMPLYSLPKHSKKLYTSPAEVSSKVVYDFAVHPGEAFTRDNLINEIKAVIKSFKPTAIFTPTLTDCHPDHRGTREFVTEVLSNMKSKTPHYEYLIHWELIEDGWPQTALDWAPPENHIPADYRLTLADFNWTPREKAKVIALHGSQIAVDGPFLESFAKNTEVFWKSRDSMGDYVRKD